MENSIKVTTYEEVENQRRLGRRVVELLGSPPNLEEICVRHLFSNAYRVNIFVMKADQKLVGDSFFIRTSGGNVDILSSHPPIKKKY